MLGKGIVFLLAVSSSLVITSFDSALVIGLISFILLIVSLLANSYQEKYRYLKTHSVIHQLLNIFLIGIVWVCINIIIFTHNTKQFLAKPLTVEVEGIICSIPAWKNQRFEFDFCVDRLNGKKLDYLALDKFKFSWDKYNNLPKVTLQAGQSWQFTVNLKPAHGRYNEGGFDYQKWMLAEGFAGNGKIKQGMLLTNSSGLESSYHLIRQSIYNKLNVLFPDDQYKALLFALTLGERGDITQQQWDVFSQTGTSHLLAISGLHIGVAALWCYWLVLFVWSLSQNLCKLFPAQTVAQIASLLGAASILLLSGMGLPAQRAFLMLSIFIISRWFGYYYRLTSVIGLVIILVLIWQPFAVLSASFWLSFLAVLIIALVLSRQEIEKSKLISWLNVNWYLYVGMLLISVLFFNLFSLVSLIANLILIPLTSFILIPTLYLGVIVTLINQTLAIWLLSLSSKILSLIYWLQFNLSNINQKLIQLEISFLSLLIGFLIIGFMLLPKRLYSKWVYLPLSIIFVLSLMIKIEQKSFEMVVFDIGQGLSIFIETPDGNLIYDTAWGNQDYSLARSTILPFLKKRHINRLDKLIISHADVDHSGGLTDISDKIVIGQLLLGEPLNKNLVEAADTTNNPELMKNSQNCHQVQDWRWGDINFSFFNYTNQKILEGNNASCVLSINTPKGKLLLTGDIEKQIENQLLNNGLSHFDVLIAPHHGSKTSSTEVFVERVSPKVVIFSTGYNNQWNFPKEEVIARYLKQNSRIYITHLDGAISVEMTQQDENLKIVSHRQKWPHFWY